MSGKEKNSLHIKDWPEGDRPREMLLEKGPEALSDAALLAILLRTGRQGLRCRWILSGSRFKQLRRCHLITLNKSDAKIGNVYGW